ncbi:MAG: hypothetical protein DDG60_14850 [Anaerolineae bacterium]|nr:MAG: hypothetical protein DDG60_14850 [Anaerolineae bacterium]
MNPVGQTHICPLCGAPLRFDPRYPRRVCPQCAAHTCDSQGRPLAFYNEALSGGIRAVLRESGQPYPSQICYIGGVRCLAQEARFGGIVIQVWEGG